MRTIFELFVERRSLLATLEELHRRGWPTKSWMTKNQKPHAGAAFTEGSLRRLLGNELYVGTVRYQDHSYRGEHPRIVPSRFWRRVQRLLCSAAATHQVVNKDCNKPGALLHGLLRCGRCGQPMSHTATRRGERRYRYYICRRCTGQSVAAPAFEASVIEQLNGMSVCRQHALGTSTSEWRVTRPQQFSLPEHGQNLEAYGVLVSLFGRRASWTFDRSRENSASTPLTT